MYIFKLDKVYHNFLTFILLVVRACVGVRARHEDTFLLAHQPCPTPTQTKRVNAGTDKARFNKSI